MKLKKSSGFTLIELLVVVAIIGILASIVLVSLNSARAKGRDASAKGSMSSMRATAEIYFDTHNDYGTGAGVISNALVPQDTSPGDPLNLADGICQYEEIVRLAQAVNNQTQNQVYCDIGAGSGGAGSSYTLEVQMNDDRYYCVDSVGYAGYVDDTDSQGDGASCL